MLTDDEMFEGPPRSALSTTMERELGAVGLTPHAPTDSSFVAGARGFTEVLQVFPRGPVFGDFRKVRIG